MNKSKEILTAIAISITVPVIAASPLEAKADTEFDESKVNLANFLVKDVTGGVSIGLTPIAKDITEPVHVPSIINGKDVIEITEMGFFESNASKIIFEDSSKIVKIGKEVFVESKATNSIQLMNITEVPYHTFLDSKFSEILIDSDKVTSIGEQAFTRTIATNTMSLTNITQVPKEAFSASSFRQINLDPNKINLIGEAAFNRVKATNVINLPLIEDVPYLAFNGADFSEINLNPSKVKTIGAQSFYQVKATNKMSLPLITEIPDDAFNDANFSEVIVDPNKITTIGKRSLRKGEAEHEISLPNITNIPAEAFSRSKFNSINIRESAITEIGSLAFSEAKGLEGKKFTFNGANLVNTPLDWKSGITNTTTVNPTANGYSLSQTGLYSTDNGVLIEGVHAINSIDSSLISTGVRVDGKSNLVVGKDFDFGKTYTYVSLPYHDEPNKIGSIAILNSIESKPILPIVDEEQLLLNLKGGSLTVNKINDGTGGGPLTDVGFNIDLTGEVKTYEQPFTDTIQVLDSRGTQEPWSLTVQAQTLKDNAQNELPSGSLTLTGRTASNHTNITSVPHYDSITETDFVIDSGSVKVGEGTVGGTYNHDFDKLKLLVDPSKVKLASQADRSKATNHYTTTITWTVSSGPGA